MRNRLLTCSDYILDDSYFILIRNKIKKKSEIYNIEDFYKCLDYIQERSIYLYLKI